MSFSHTLTISYDTGDGSPIIKEIAESAESEQKIDVAVPDGSTDLQIDLDIDVTQLKAIILVSDQAITLETNDGTTPADTIVLVADEPYIWWSGATWANKITTDVTALYATNGGANAANLKIRVAQDATP